MTNADKQRLFAALLQRPRPPTPERRTLMADDLIAIAFEDEERLRACDECGQELRTAAHQLAASVVELTGCTSQQRFELRQLATFMLRHADKLAPVASVHDPDAVLDLGFLDDAA